MSTVMLEYLEKRGREQEWSGLETKVVDGNAELDLPKSSYTHIFLSFAVFVMPTVLPKLYALLHPGGFIAQMEEAGFEEVETPRQKKMADCGSADEFCETMQFPLKMIAGFWEEE
ncbi:hypothetical protein EJ02DRAFT_439169 [Clathrospora elynae]|uniref:Methyltransferase type 11 domain-containing protein n=1 Tax=Clathrospora elynae TaxID=706981 RepID=A0A6A5S644_9PLEO|nr:hypothetical protein EJ02DRAFT_439169 [Clathrospora elynae]